MQSNYEIERIPQKPKSTVRKHRKKKYILQNTCKQYKQAKKTLKYV